MAVAAKSPQAESTKSPRTAQILTVILIVLSAVAAAAGIFLPDLYQGTEWLIGASRGTDVYTLAVAVPAMIVTLFFLRRGALRPTLVMTGVVAYMLYTFIGTAMTYAFNGFFPVYVATMSVSFFTLAALIGTIDLGRIDQRFDATAPRKPMAIFLIVNAVMLAMMEMGQMMPYYSTGELPQPMRLAASTIFYPLVLDLGMIMPLSLLAGIWLWQRRPWGYLLTSCMLIKSATMGLALLATNFYGWLAGIQTDSIEWLIGYGVIGFGGLAMSVWFFRHCRS
ncbi:MAG TPA: hypothetical protein VNT75_25185 [Symbiobacteriaceae bacterium]|nr:hypothetical protein [Symbiobacteriaceae bacterium]